MNLFRRRRALLLSAAVVGAIFSGAGSALLGLCGPFTDVSDATFCPFVLEIFVLGITTGTTPTTYDPNGTVNRIQMAAFLARTVDGSLKRGSRRGALDQFWTTQNATALGRTVLGSPAELLKSDGANIWVATSGGAVMRVRASDGKLLDTWTGATSAVGVLVAMGRIFVTGDTSPGNLYQIYPDLAAGEVTTVASSLGNNSRGITFDGARVWTANHGGSVSIATPGVQIPWTVTTVASGFLAPTGALYDGANVWVTDMNAGTLLKLDSTGAIFQTVTVGSGPEFPVFDGTNIWVPSLFSNSVAVVRASSGNVLQTLTGNGLTNPIAAAFDGQRVLITNLGGDSVSLWKAAGLAALGSFPTGSITVPKGACSDGVNFWIALNSTGQLARF